MKRSLTLRFLLIALAVTWLLSPLGAQPNTATAFVDVTVVPMDRERLIERQTVVVRDGRILAMGPAASTPVPDAALRIDGRGRFLMPGLVDMHVHISPGAGEAADPAGRVLRLLLANGITTARSMIGNPSHLALRDRLNAGAIIGPTIVAAGPPLWGKELPTPEDAARVVREQKAAGYDFIKLIVGFQPPTYDAIVNAASAAGIPVAGHVDPQVGLPAAIKARQQVEHLDSFLEEIVADSATARRSSSQLNPGAILEQLDERRIPGVVRSIVDAGIYNCPTLALFRRIASDETAEALTARPEMRYITAQALTAWGGQITNMRNSAPPAERRARFVDIRNTLTKALADADAPLLAGSDSPQFFMVAGFALHQELESLAAAGLTPYQALRAATATPAEYFRQSEQWGTIAVGKRADVLLLSSNPLLDVRHAARHEGVMVRGHWHDSPALRHMLEDVAASAKAHSQD